MTLKVISRLVGDKKNFFIILSKFFISSLVGLYEKYNSSTEGSLKVTCTCALLFAAIFMSAFIVRIFAGVIFAASELVVSCVVLLCKVSSVCLSLVSINSKYSSLLWSCWVS